MTTAPKKTRETYVGPDDCLVAVSLDGLILRETLIRDFTEDQNEEIDTIGNGILVVTGGLIAIVKMTGSGVWYRALYSREWIAGTDWPGRVR